MDEMRDRLIIKILQALEDYRFRDGTHPIGCAEYVADTLLAAGVILPKFRVNQEVWVLNRGHSDTFKDEIFMYSGVAGFLQYHMKKSLFYKEDEVFATELEALDALAKQK